MVPQLQIVFAASLMVVAAETSHAAPGTRPLAPHQMQLAAAMGAALGSAKDIDESLGLIDKVLGKLKAQPDLAVHKLTEALDEINKTLRVIDDAANRYQNLAIESGALQKGSQMLGEIEGGGLVTAVEAGRGHCHKIGIIYGQYLDTWFQRALDPAEYASVRGVFRKLGDADRDLFRVLIAVAESLQREASGVLDLVLKGRTNDARSRVLDARKELLPLRRLMNHAMQTLYRLRGEFGEIAAVA
jgi:hypothetical protein